MEPIQLEGMNRKLSPPQNWNPEVDGECGDLHVFAQVPPGGALRMTSAWKPDAEELAALARGCPVALTVFGSAIPPMALGVFDYEMPKNEDSDAKRMRLENALLVAAAELADHMGTTAIMLPHASSGVFVVCGLPAQIRRLMGNEFGKLDGEAMVAGAKSRERPDETATD